jgi:hypothetical protein
MELTLDEKARAAHGLVSILQLLRLDRVWTHYLDGATTVPPDDVAALERVTSEMLELLSDIPATAQWLHEIVDRDVEAFETALRSGLERMPVSPEVRQRSRERLVDGHQAAQFIARAARELPQQIKIEQQDITDKMARVKRGELTGGDLSEAGTCALLGVGLGLASVGIVVSTAAAGPEAALLLAVVVGEVGAAGCL